MRARVVCVGLTLLWVLGVQSLAQAQEGAAPGRGGRAGGGPSARAAAPIDLTGTWVPLITEDWRWRMRVPPKGDVASLPLNDAGTKVALAWDPARDAAAGESCRGYGAPAVMRLPGRVRMTWDGDAVLKVETEAGTQTRRFAFGPPAPNGAADWQGTSTASWQYAGGARRGGPGVSGALRVVTTNLRPGYLRRNGVPYSASTRLTEFYNQVSEPTGETWLVVTTIVEDPVYLAVPRWVTSTHFKKETAGAAWNPMPCE